MKDGVPYGIWRVAYSLRTTCASSSSSSSSSSLSIAGSPYEAQALNLEMQGASSQASSRGSTVTSGNCLRLSVGLPHTSGAAVAWWLSQAPTPGLYAEGPQTNVWQVLT